MAGPQISVFEDQGFQVEADVYSDPRVDGAVLRLNSNNQYLTLHMNSPAALTALGHRIMEAGRALEWKQNVAAAKVELNMEQQEIPA